VLTGAGTAFSAGGDIETLTKQLEWTLTENERYMKAFYRKYLSLLSIEVPVIAAINGHAIGAGLSLALACDIRLAAETARMGVTFVNLGLHPGMATLHLLPLILGEARAADLILTGRLVEAREALAIGLVDRVHAPDTLMGAAVTLAKELAAKPGTAARTSKRALAARKLAGLDEALDRDAKLQAASFASSEMRAAIGSLTARAR
jgi:enoyl-CoA hydratase/carnithine racemase